MNPLKIFVLLGLILSFSNNSIAQPREQRRTLNILADETEISYSLSSPFPGNRPESTPENTIDPLKVLLKKMNEYDETDNALAQWKQTLKKLIQNPAISNPEFIRMVHELLRYCQELELFDSEHVSTAVTYLFEQSENRSILFYVELIEVDLAPLSISSVSTQSSSLSSSTSTHEPKGEMKPEILIGMLESMYKENSFAHWKTWVDALLRADNKDDIAFQIAGFLIKHSQVNMISMGKKESYLYLFNQLRKTALLEPVVSWVREMSEPRIQNNIIERIESITGYGISGTGFSSPSESPLSSSSSYYPGYY